MRTKLGLVFLKSLNPAIKNIFDFKYEDIEITSYDPYPVIKAEVAV